MFLYNEEKHLEHFKCEPMRRQWQPTPVLLPGKSHGRKSLVGCSPWGRWGSDTTERLHFHFSLSCIGEGNGNPLQCPCLENPRDGGAWWAAVYGVAQSRTRLKWLSITWLNNSSLYLLYPFLCWCFHVLAIVNSAAMNAGVCIFLINVQGDSSLMTWNFSGLT